LRLSRFKIARNGKSSFTSIPGEGPVVLWDVASLPAWAQVARDPEAYARGVRNTIETYTAMSRSELDVQLHEILLGADWVCPITPQVLFGLSGGLTVNVVDWSMTHATVWTDSSGATVRTDLINGSDEDVVLGASAEASLRCNIGDEGRYFVEVHGGFAWVDELDVGAGTATGDLDLTSWTAGGSVGVDL